MKRETVRKNGKVENKGKVWSCFHKIYESIIRV